MIDYDDNNDNEGHDGDDHDVAPQLLVLALYKLLFISKDDWIFNHFTVRTRPPQLNHLAPLTYQLKQQLI